MAGKKKQGRLGLMRTRTFRGDTLIRTVQELIENESGLQRGSVRLIDPQGRSAAPIGRFGAWLDRWDPGD